MKKRFRNFFPEIETTFNKRLFERNLCIKFNLLGRFLQVLLPDNVVACFCGNNESRDSPLRKIKGFVNDQMASDYANSLIQCLFNIKIVKELIRDSTDGVLRQALIEFEDLSKTSNLDLTNLRLQFVGSRKLNVQQIPSELFAHVIKHPDTNYLQQLFSFDVLISKHCFCRETNRTMKAFTFHLDIPDKHLRKKGETLTIRDLLQFNLDQDWKASEERCLAFNLPLLTKMVCSRFSSIIIFVLQSEQKVAINLENVEHDDIFIGTDTYELNSAIWHHGDNLKSGHYRAFLRIGTVWIEANDRKIQIRNWPDNGKDLYMLFYVRKSRLRKVKRSKMTRSKRRH